MLESTKKILNFLERIRPRYSMQNIEMVFSSFFFCLALFSILVVIFAKFASGLGELFKLVSQPYGVVFIFTIVLLCFSLVLCVYIFILTLKTRIMWQFLPISFLALVMCILFIVAEIGYFSNTRTVLDPVLVDIVTDNAPMELDFFIHDVLDVVFSIFFVLLPLGIILCGYKLNKADKWGRILQFLRPRLSISIVACFGLWIRPFDFEDIYSLIGFILLSCATIVILWCLLKTKQRVSFYEILNTILLLLGIGLFLSNQQILEDAMSCYEFRRMFFALVFFGWNNGWIFRVIMSFKNR